MKILTINGEDEQFVIAKELALRTDPVNPVPPMTLDQIDLLDEEGLHSRVAQWCYHYLWASGLYEVVAVQQIYENKEVQHCFDILDIDIHQYAGGGFTNKKDRQLFLDYGKMWYDKVFTGMRNLAVYNRRKDYIMTELIMNQIFEKIQQDGIDSISVQDAVSLMNRRAKISGSDAPSRVDIGLSDSRVDFTSEDVNSAIEDLRRSGYLPDGDSSE